MRAVAATARQRGVEVFTAFCESHTSHIPFHAVARLLRAATGVEGHDAQAARDQLRERVSDADPEDLCFLMTCWALLILMGFATDRSGCASAAGDRAGECCVVGP